MSLRHELLVGGAEARGSALNVHNVLLLQGLAGERVLPVLLDNLKRSQPIRNGAKGGHQE